MEYTWVVCGLAQLTWVAVPGHAFGEFMSVPTSTEQLVPATVCHGPVRLKAWLLVAALAGRAVVTRVAPGSEAEQDSEPG